MKSLQKTLRPLFRWETLLLALLAGLCLAFNRQDALRQAAGLSKKDVFNLAGVVKGLRPYMLYSFMTLGMMLVLAMGDIDISTGASAALSVAVMGVVYKALTGGAPSAPPLLHSICFILSILACLAAGAACGLANGLLVTRFKELFPMIITLATQLFFRGVSYLLLGGGTLTFKSDATFDLLKHLYDTFPLGGLAVPVVLPAFLAAAAVFAVWTHFTGGGRRLFAIGTNWKASRLSGVRVDRVKLGVFTLCGGMAAVTGVFFVGATSSSIRADAMMGYEMYAIAAAVLGGFSTSGGKGSVPGVVISLVIFGVLKIGLGTLYGFADSMVNLAVGAVLVASTLLPNLAGRLRAQWRVSRQRAAVSTRGGAFG